MSQIVIPGQSLAAFSAASPAQGTHLFDSQVVSSLAGPLLPPRTKSATTAVQRRNPLLPEVGTVVLGRIVRTNARQAAISILALVSNGEHICRDEFPGLIRQQDIRATEIDKVKVQESFKVGDIVRAVVISLGDERSYYLSTAKNEFGVIMATSEMGNPMYPLSWQEFQDPQEGTRERRKVAKPV